MKKNVLFLIAALLAMPVSVYAQIDGELKQGKIESGNYPTGVRSMSTTAPARISSSQASRLMLISEF